VRPDAQSAARYTAAARWPPRRRGQQLVDAVRRRQLDAWSPGPRQQPRRPIAAARIEEADAVLRQVDAALLPQVNANAGSRSRISQTNATPPHRRSHSNKLGLSTSFELDVWGKLRRASEAARAQALGTRYASDTVSLSLAAAVTQAYLNLRAIDAQLLVTATR
jgi:multidrug efflux system outer membrane protein